MTKFAFDTALMPGTWYLWQTGKKRVFLACSSCGAVAMIELDDIDEDGTILGGFKCKKQGCAFTDEVLLLEWDKRP